MTREHFRQLRHLFDAAMDLSTADRTAFIDQATEGDPELRAELDRLVAGAGPTLPADFSALLVEPGADRWEGRRLGAYQILRELGRGGMGTVYLAARADHAFQKLVAIKLLRSDAATTGLRPRFQREREILAGLEHPGIARLLDAGETEHGLPYLVMEYVEGVPIDQHCREQNLAIDDRLRLFESVCDAVEYAHSRGVIHRDLKPGNILVTAQGQVKLLDFGIAGLLEEASSSLPTLTRTGMALMTPEYASPEQVRSGDVGAASDVYTLGVLLYELLTGSRPYRLRSRLLHEVVRIICEEEPTRPSTAVTKEDPENQSPVPGSPESLSRALKGDLDNILLKALEKHPAHRYQSARALAEDLERHLQHRPVTARAGVWWYQLWRLIERNRAWVLAAFVVVFAFATGTLKVDRTVLFLASIMVPSYLLGAWFSLRSYGPEMVRRFLFSSVVRVVVILAATSLGIKLLSGHSLQSSSNALMAACILWLAFAEVRWLARKRLCGQLLLDLSRPRVLYHLILGGFIPLTGIGVVVTSTQDSIATIHAWLWFTWSILSSIQMLYIHHVCEFRAQGIISSVGWLPWHRISSYEWEPPTGRHVLVKLNFAGWYWRLLPNRRLVIPIDQRDEADCILAAQFRTWPG